MVLFPLPHHIVLVDICRLNDWGQAFLQRSINAEYFLKKQREAPAIQNRMMIAHHELPASFSQIRQLYSYQRRTLAIETLGAVTFSQSFPTFTLDFRSDTFPVKVLPGQLHIALHNLHRMKKSFPHEQCPKHGLAFTC